MKWYRVDDETQGQAVLIEASSSVEATRIYQRDYAPNLYVSEAEAAEVEDWKRDLVQWAKDDQSPMWVK